MKNTKQHLESLSEIKNLMERSTKFISLSGLSGIIAGITALAGATLAYLRLDYYLNSTSLDNETIRYMTEYLTFELIGIAASVLVISLFFGVVLTKREAKKNSQSIWDKSSLLLLSNLLIPLISGGILC